VLHHHNEKEEKEMYACVERENFCRCCSRTRKSARAHEGKQMWCDEGGGAAKIIGCIASRVVRLLVHVDSKDKLYCIYYRYIDVKRDEYTYIVKTHKSGYYLCIYKWGWHVRKEKIRCTLYIMLFREKKEKNSLGD